MVWIWSGVLPLALSSLKKATLESPLSVLKIAFGFLASTSETIGATFVSPSGRYFSSTMFIPLAAAQALISLLAVRGNT